MTLYLRTWCLWMWLISQFWLAITQKNILWTCHLSLSIFLLVLEAQLTFNLPQCMSYLMAYLYGFNFWDMLCCIIFLLVQSDDRILVSIKVRFIFWIIEDKKFKLCIVDSFFVNHWSCFVFCCWISHWTCSSPRCPVCYHSLVCSEKYF